MEGRVLDGKGSGPGTKGFSRPLFWSGSTPLKHQYTEVPFPVGNRVSWLIFGKLLFYCKYYIDEVNRPFESNVN